MLYLYILRECVEDSIAGLTTYAAEKHTGL